MEIIETSTNKVQQRVVVLRVPYDESDTMKTFFTTAFSEDTTLNTSYLAR